jgi:hypothetical protein
MALELPQKFYVSNKRFMFDDINKMTINTKWFLLQIRDLFTIKNSLQKIIAFQISKGST